MDFRGLFSEGFGGHNLDKKLLLVDITHKVRVKKTLHTVVLRRRHSGTTVNKTRLSDGLATLTAVTTVQDKRRLTGRTKIAVGARANR